MSVNPHPSVPGMRMEYSVYDGIIYRKTSVKAAVTFPCLDTQSVSKSYAAFPKQKICLKVRAS